MGRGEASDALLRRAIGAYDELAARIELIGDPDLGLEVVHSCGRRRLLARANARTWTVPASVVQRIDELMAGLESADEAARIDWLEAFPSEVTRALERRHPGAVSPADGPRRRMIDWVGRPAVVATSA